MNGFQKGREFIAGKREKYPHALDLPVTVRPEQVEAIVGMMCASAVRYRDWRTHLFSTEKDRDAVQKKLGGRIPLA